MNRVPVTTVERRATCTNSVQGSCGTQVVTWLTVHLAAGWGDDSSRLEGSVCNLTRRVRGTGGNLHVWLAGQLT